MILDINKIHLKDAAEYFAEQEDLQVSLRDGCEKYSDDYNYHQKVFGIYCRARIQTENDLEKLSRGERIGFG